jgi:RNA polymerase sigma factor (sigma-70 family)
MKANESNTCLITLYFLCQKQARYLSKNPTDAEDLAGEMFLNILEKNKLEKYDPSKSQFHTWLNRVMKNFYCDNIKKHNKMIYVDDYSAESLGREAMTEYLLDKKLKIQVIKNMLQEKNSRSGLVIFYLYILDFTPSETAKKLEMPKKNIASYKIRGLKMLQEEFKKRRYV